MELFSYSDDAASEGQIRQFLNSVSMVYKLKLPDAIIAATAIFLDAELLTNDKQMQRVPGLVVRTLAVKSA
ncbi:MAG: PIN domain-containing protein [Bryobacteraceae bacterium]